LTWVGCSSSSTPTTPTTSTPFNASEVFSGSLDPLATVTHTFSIPQSVTLSVMFASLSDAASGQLLSTPLTFQLGTSDGTTCTLTGNPTTTSPALAAQSSTSQSAGTFCLKLADPGNLAATANFAIRLSQDSTPNSVGTSGTDMFSVRSTTLSTVSHSFQASSNGMVTVTLASLTPSANVGLGLGITGGPSDCTLNTMVTTGPGSSPQISATVDLGNYCIKLVNLGTFSGPVSFTINTVHP
jgi:hypothetical protein